MFFQLKLFDSNESATKSPMCLYYPQKFHFDTNIDNYNMIFFNLLCIDLKENNISKYYTESAKAQDELK